MFKTNKIYIALVAFLLVSFFAFPKLAEAQACEVDLDCYDGYVCVQGDCAYRGGEGEGEQECPYGCDDENPCTEDWCENSECIFQPIEGCGEPEPESEGCFPGCDDENPCTEDWCENNECIFVPIEGCGEPEPEPEGCWPDCNDENPCTEDWCENNECMFRPIEGCGEPEPEPEGCFPGCNDENPCTEDWCENNECMFRPIEGCGEPEGCPYGCDDGNPCTEDWCENGGCIFQPIEGCGEPEPEFECLDDMDCIDDHECIAGFCEPIPKPEPTPEPECFDDMDCLDDHECISGFCEPIPGSEPECFDDMDCLEDEFCLDGFCEPISEGLDEECIDDMDCLDDQECIDGFCESIPGEPTIAFDVDIDSHQGLDRSLRDTEEALGEASGSAGNECDEKLAEDIQKYRKKLERVKYFQGRLLTEEDLETEQEYMRLKLLLEELQRIQALCLGQADDIIQDAVNETEVPDKYKKPETITAKLFGFIPLGMDVEVAVDAQTGEKTIIKKPWWAFLSTEKAPVSAGKVAGIEIGSCSGNDICRTCMDPAFGAPMTECGTFYGCQPDNSNVTCVTPEGLVYTEAPPLNHCKGAAKVCDVCTDKFNNKFIDCKSPATAQPQLAGATAGSCSGKDVCRSCIDPAYGTPVTECGLFEACADRSQAQVTCMTPEGLTITEYPPLNQCKGAAKVCEICEDGSKNKFIECKDPSSFGAELSGVTAGSCSGKDECRTCIDPGMGILVKECGVFQACTDRSQAEVTCITAEGFTITETPPLDKCKNAQKVCEICSDSSNNKFIECKDPGTFNVEYSGATAGSCSGKDECRTCIDPGMGILVKECAVGGVFQACTDRSQAEVTCITAEGLTVTETPPLKQCAGAQKVCEICSDSSNNKYIECKDPSSFGAELSGVTAGSCSGKDECRTCIDPGMGILVKECAVGGVFQACLDRSQAEVTCITAEGLTVTETPPLKQCAGAQKVCEICSDSSNNKFIECKAPSTFSVEFSGATAGSCSGKDECRTCTDPAYGAPIYECAVVGVFQGCIDKAKSEVTCITKEGFTVTEMPPLNQCKGAQKVCTICTDSTNKKFIECK
ncbi:hypothetical protein KJ742_06320 [Patescibacteria group bacterium]|nr:hypothetical protein [Patescibacteria group bacterium]MBU1683526.1 hypothetical protein [Patescibacteria group bacterium]